MFQFQNTDNDETSNERRSKDLENNESHVRRKWEYSDFEIKQQLGEGRFGTVYLARENISKHQFALKVIELCESKQRCENYYRLQREIQIHSQLKHPNVIRMFGFFQTEEQVVFVMEYSPNGDLYRRLRRERRFDEVETAKYIAQVAKGLKYCHSKEVIHRDIKPENILIGAQGELKICDFGLSVYLRSETRIFAEGTFYGTLDYLSPEMVESRCYDKSIDLWSVGVLCYELLVGNPPFQSSTAKETLKSIKRVDLYFPQYLSPGACDFICKLLRRNPSKRLSLDGVLAHPWINNDNTVKRTKNNTFTYLFNQMKKLCCV